METNKSINRIQDVAFVKQNHDEQIADEKEDLHTETRPEQYANWENELLSDQGLPHWSTGIPGYGE